MRFAICLRWKWTRPRCFLRTIPATDSTTMPTFSASLPCCWNDISRAAGKISALAMGDPEIGPAVKRIRIRQDASQDRHIEGLPLGTVGGRSAQS